MTASLTIPFHYMEKNHFGEYSIKKEKDSFSNEERKSYTSSD